MTMWVMGVFVQFDYIRDVRRDPIVFVRLDKRLREMDKVVLYLAQTQKVDLMALPQTVWRVMQYPVVGPGGVHRRFAGTFFCVHF